MKEVSVIITTKNESGNIANCLDSIMKQAYPAQKIEIIVVDNNSTDDTVKIAAKFTDRIYNYGPERAAQRNFGIKNAQGKYILYLDTDMILSEDVIRECVEECVNNGYIGLYIPERVIGKGFWSRVRDFERSFYNATAIDCVRFVRRDKIQEIGGFDENLTGPEDWDFDRRIRSKGEAGIIKSVLYHDEGGFELGAYVKKKLYYSGSFNKYIDKWGHGDPTVKKQLGVWYRFFGVFMEDGKWVRLIMHPFLALGLFFLRTYLGVNYLLKKE